MLNDPIAQQLLVAPIPAHLSYVWTDGSPRVIPIGFTWTGSELVTGTLDKAPRVKALIAGSANRGEMMLASFPRRRGRINAK